MFVCTSVNELMFVLLIFKQHITTRKSEYNKNLPLKCSLLF